MSTLTCRWTSISQDGRAEASRSPPFTFMSLHHSHITVTDIRLLTRRIMVEVGLTRVRIGETQEWIHTEQVRAKIHTIEILTEEVHARIPTIGTQTGGLDKTTRCVGNPQIIRTGRVLTRIRQPNKETQTCNSLSPRPLLQQVIGKGFIIILQEDLQCRQPLKTHKRKPVPSSQSRSTPRVQRYQLCQTLHLQLQ